MLRPTLSLLASLALCSATGCGASSASSADASSSGTSTRGADAGGTQSGPNDSGTTALPDTGEPGVRFVGRVDGNGPDGVRFQWSGTGLVARFTGTSIGVRLSGGQQYTLLIDGEVQPRFIPSGMDMLAEGLADGEHTVELYRRTEANQGISTFAGFDLGDSKLLAPPPAPSRRIEVIGDSISCGYGNEGADMNCPFTPDTENHYLTYGAIAARELGAELSTVAWSGKGVVCNYGDDAASCTNPLPQFYGRAIPYQEDSVWDSSDWQADAVVINLGTNDVSTSVDPTQEEFVTAYEALLLEVRELYPHALILCTNGPMLSGTDLGTVKGYIQNAVDARVAAGDERVTTFDFATQSGADGYGCDWHPSLTTHENMARVLVDVLRDQLSWED